MRNKTKFKLLLLFLVTIFCFANFAYAADGTIDPNYKYAWGENMGWLNFAATSGDVVVSDTALTGYVWSENYGWINLAPTNSGVVNNCSGILSGNAWSEGLGWIDFTGVTINSVGEFTGMAGDAEDPAGRINFDCLNCDVRTDWRHCIATQCSDGNDNDNDGDIDLDDDDCSSAEDNKESPDSVTKHPPSAPTSETPSVISTTEIQWNFSDTASNENGFKLLDITNLWIKTEEIPNISFILETGLTPNTSYSRQVVAYNSDGDSSSATLGPVYTWAATPNISLASADAESAIRCNLLLENNNNPVETLYAVFETTTGKWLQSDNTLGDVQVFKPRTDWGGSTSIFVSGLTTNQLYKFRIMAQNGDGINTDLSSEVMCIPGIVSGPNLILSKIVGINLPPAYSQAVIFGKPVFASGFRGEVAEFLPTVSTVTNDYLVGALIILLLFVILLLINITEKKALLKMKKIKHLYQIFWDWKSKKVDFVYDLLHGKDELKEGKKYTRHKIYYRYAALSAVFVVAGVIVKLFIVAGMLAVLSGGVGVYAFDNESGLPVHIGDTLTYRVDYISNGTMDVTNIYAEDSIPAQASYIAGSLKLNGAGQSDADDNDDCYKYGSIITCHIEEAEHGTSGYFEFKALVAGVVGNTLVNIASANHDNVSASLFSNAVSNIIELEGPSACSDTLDNDGDGKIDYPADPGCSTVFDDDEADIAPVVCGDALCGAGETCSTCPGDCGLCVEKKACEDGLDNDSDGKIDYPADPGCTAATDTDETDIIPAVCGDTQCNGTETCSTCPGDCGICPKKQCEDGLDNDNDGKIDYPADPGCLSAQDNNEVDPLPAVCGDSLCNGSETCNTCSQDCGVCPADVTCGDNICNGDETCSTCQQDCGICPAVITCGDSLCNGDENCATCDIDCGVCEEGEIPDGSATACADNIDNDGDGKIDMEDPGCINLNDTDETDEVLTPEEKDEQERAQAEKEIEDKLETKTGTILVDTISSIVSGLTRKDIEQVKQDVKKAISQTLFNSIDNPGVEKINDFAQEPVAVASTVASVASIATVGITGAAGVSLLTYLQFLFTQPFLLLSRRRRQNWGIVYDSITKKPLDLAIVRLFEQETRRLVTTRVTDKRGRYQFFAKPGRYYLEVAKKEYKFPSEVIPKLIGLHIASIVGKPEESIGEHIVDGEYQNLYNGGLIEIKAGESGIVNRSVPVDPDKKIETNKAIFKRLMWNRIQKLLTFVGPVIAIVSYIINPQLWVGVLVLVQIAIYFIFRRLSRVHRPLTWGRVKDLLTGHKLKKTVVRVFDIRFNKLLDTQVTDNDGKYGFLVSPGEYYLTSNRDGYLPYKSDPLDLVNKDTAYIAEEIKMKPSVTIGQIDPMKEEVEPRPATETVVFKNQANKEEAPMNLPDLKQAQIVVSNGQVGTADQPKMTIEQLKHQLNNPIIKKPDGKDPLSGEPKGTEHEDFFDLDVL